MLNALKRRVKNEKGLTLIELLAVVVILGIIAAIAIPAIGGLIENSRKDAHIANATQMINSAKTWAAGNASEIGEGADNAVTLDLEDDMVAGGLIDEVTDPFNSNEAYQSGSVVITKTDTTFNYVVNLDSNDDQYDITDQPQSALKRSLFDTEE